jgi:cellulose biosynthesis protein BcsQ
LGKDSLYKYSQSIPCAASKFKLESLSLTSWSTLIDTFGELFLNIKINNVYRNIFSFEDANANNKKDENLYKKPLQKFLGGF